MLPAMIAFVRARPDAVPWTLPVSVAGMDLSSALGGRQSCPDRLGSRDIRDGESHRQAAVADDPVAVFAARGDREGGGVVALLGRQVERKHGMQCRDDLG